MESEIINDEEQVVDLRENKWWHNDNIWCFLDDEDVDIDHGVHDDRDGRGDHEDDGKNTDGVEILPLALISPLAIDNFSYRL